MTEPTNPQTPSINETLPPPPTNPLDPNLPSMPPPPMGLPPGFGEMGQRPASPLPPIVFNIGRRGIMRRIRGTEERLVGTLRNDKLVGDRRNNRLMGGAGNDTLDGGIGNDRLFGDAGNDKLSGGVGNDQLFGGSGDDLLEGGAGNDQLNGGVGDDILQGGQGRDMMAGGAGKDTFRYGSLKEGGDLIKDFNVQQDLIDLRPIFAQPNFASATDPQQLKSLFKMERIGTSTRIMIDADGTGSGQTFVNVATLQGVAPSALTLANFVVA